MNQKLKKFFTFAKKLANEQSDNEQQICKKNSMFVPEVYFQGNKQVFSCKMQLYERLCSSVDPTFRAVRPVRPICLSSVCQKSRIQINLKKSKKFLDLSQLLAELVCRLANLFFKARNQNTRFLVACTRLYKSLCWFVGWSVRRLVAPSRCVFLCVFECFEHI